MFFALRRLSARPAGQQSTALALLSALGVAIAGAVIWGLVSKLFNVQLSLIGVVIGAGVGYAVARFRPGHLPTIVAGVVIAIFGCALGTYLAIVFSLLSTGYGLGTILSHTGTVLHGYPSYVGGFGLLFWLVAGFAAVRVPWQSQRFNARRGAVPPGYGPPPGGGYGHPGYGQAPDLPPFTGPAGPAGPGTGPSEPA